MKEYDVIVIGSGSGMRIVEQAVARKLKVALVDKGPAGGTCLNTGCIPSKMLIAAADRVQEIREAGRFGIDAKVTRIDHGRILKRMRDEVGPTHKAILKDLRDREDLDFYEESASFAGPRTLDIRGQKISAQKVFIGSGSRPFVPEMLQDAEYLTNESVLDLDSIPESIIIIGGGFIAVEYAHFFEAMGSEVTLVQRNERLVPDEDADVSALLEKEFRKRMTIHTGMEVTGVKKVDGGCVLTGRTADKDIECRGKELLLAIGRRSNADTLHTENAGIDLDRKGFIKVNPRLETSSEGVWAFGDAIGSAMFTHAANREAEIAWHNATSNEKRTVDSMVPHAVYSWPQIASIGMAEDVAAKDHELVVETVRYDEVTRGSALRQDGFAKCILEKGSGRLLGFHIIGHYAPILIQEITNAIESGSLRAVADAMHIHPSMPELIQKTLVQARRRSG